MESADMVAAGAVVLRRGPEVLLVHRPKYDDWSFPKGKVDPGEHVLAAAVREVAEETGIDVRLGVPLPQQTYPVADGRTKLVHYWVARVDGDDDVSGYHPNDEIDDVRWVDLEKAAGLLTYARDRQVLEHAAAVRKRTGCLVVLRHGKARPRKHWEGDDAERPLADAGSEQAEELVPLLAAYGVRRVVSSSALRCWTTVAPYAEVADVDLEVTDDLDEEGATPASVTSWVQRFLARGAKDHPTVVCTHRPVLPMVFDALGVEDRSLDAGSMLVVHHRRGRVVALEQHVTDAAVPGLRP